MMSLNIINIKSKCLKELGHLKSAAKNQAITRSSQSIIHHFQMSLTWQEFPRKFRMALDHGYSISTKLILRLTELEARI